ncbi:short-chain dehydrogenase [Neorhizobium sp. P12A]|uniref:SDR family oxidoreductase n=1 Tax=Neorhizobium sp. P12A TaxID=2268027 RepID=UPI0011ED98D7|nr:SDR family oxidoreductase [Neorhizobium sp. P12A]KAA0699260.1 short-chain dehydrogenase [Neorhizobium sp. P12A]
MSRLQNKTALITGGTSGIGLETARQFIAEGARVAITGSSARSVETARAELGDKALVIQADAGHVEGQKAVAEAVKTAFGHLDILFVNAGVAEFGPLEQWSEAAFDKSIAINVKGPFFLVQALLPIFSNPASIVLNTSINAHIGMPNSSVYSLTKGALLTFAKTLSGELIDRGIRVNAVSPGPIATPLYDKLGATAADSKAMTDHIKSQIPVGRFGDPAEVAKTIVFLASDEAAYIVGSELVIDGGMSNL